jgi:tetratricopeptide (TPR) repeat protein
VAPVLPATQTTITREQAEAALTAARGLIDQKAHADARARLGGVIPDAEKWGWLDVAADAHYLNGEAFDRERNPRDAADEYTRAYEASRRLGDQARGLRSLNALTNAFLDAGALAKATEAATEADRLARRRNDLSAQATAQNNLAEANRLAGRLIDARDGYERALGLARQANDRLALTSILMNLGTAERRSGRLAQARARFAEARDLARDLDDRPAGAYAEWNLEQIEAEIRHQGADR